MGWLDKYKKKNPFHYTLKCFFKEKNRCQSFLLHNRSVVAHICNRPVLILLCKQLDSDPQQVGLAYSFMLKGKWKCIIACCIVGCFFLWTRMLWKRVLDLNLQPPLVWLENVRINLLSDPEVSRYPSCKVTQEFSCSSETNSTRWCTSRGEILFFKKGLYISAFFSSVPDQVLRAPSALSRVSTSLPCVTLYILIKCKGVYLSLSFARYELAI